MIRLNRKQQRLPIGGHHYPEPGLMIKEETFDDVVKRLRSFRLDNGVKLGNPEADVLRYYAEKFPYMVEEYWPQRTDDDVDRDYLRYAHWIRTAWQNPPKGIISSKEAEFRWDKCKTCKCNVQNRWKTGHEQEDLLRRSFMLRHGLHAPSFLGFCTCNRWDNSVAVFLSDPEGFSAKEKTAEQEPGCWLSSLVGR